MNAERSAAEATAVAAAFDPSRLVQGRRLQGLTKAAVAERLKVSAAAVGQWEAGVVRPRPEHIGKLADALEVPISFLAAGRPYARLDSAAAHFRSLRKTPAIQRAKAVAFTEQVWELAHALERRVQFPAVDLPAVGTADPEVAARALREHWGLGLERIRALVRTMESRGLIVTMVPFAGSATATVDAFSTSALPRPLVVLTPDRGRDVYGHRFSAAHELGHLLLHADSLPGDPAQEREADAFAAELLTPREVITPLLPRRMDLAALGELSQAWGVSVDSLIYRCHEVGVVSELAYRRAYQRLNQQRSLGLFRRESVEGYPGEIPTLLQRAFELAVRDGLTLADLAGELACKVSRVRILLGQGDVRPELKLV